MVNSDKFEYSQSSSVDSVFYDGDVQYYFTVPEFSNDQNDLEILHTSLRNNELDTRLTYDYNNLNVYSFSSEQEITKDKKDIANSLISETTQQSELKSTEYDSSKYWCEPCKSYFKTECKKHGPLIYVEDHPPLTFARMSLPSSLVLKKNSAEVEYVVAKKTIAMNTCFGPLKGRKTINEISSNNGFHWKITTGSGWVYIDNSDETISNWMMFVRPAETYAQMNLVAYQHCEEIYFVTTKQINVFKELKVWYAKHYAELIGQQCLDLREFEQGNNSDKRELWPCYECDKKFASSASLQRHLDKHDAGEGVESSQSTACQSCHKNFLSPSILATHALRCVNNPSKKTLTCKICGESFSRRYLYLKHIGDLKNKCYQEEPPNDSSDVSNFNCATCNLNFENEQLLGLHQCIHETDIKQLDEHVVSYFHCIDCKLDFSGLDALEKHTCPSPNTVSSDSECPSFCLSVLVAVEEGGDLVQRYVCIDCKALLISLHVAHYHRLRHDHKYCIPGATDRCPLCLSMFKNKRELAHHVSEHATTDLSRSQRNLFECVDCNQPFRSFTAYQAHVAKHEDKTCATDNVTTTFVCKQCYKVFSTSGGLHRHERYHSDSPKVHSCVFCNERFSSPLCIGKHVALRHVNSSGYYPCPHCPARFSSYGHCKRHIFTIHLGDDTHKCTICLKVFNRCDLLKSHMLTHSNTYNFPCTQCSKKFKVKEQLRSHTIRIHSRKKFSVRSSSTFVPLHDPKDVDMFPFRCQKCKIGFRRRGMLLNHVRSRHPDINPSETPDLSAPVLRAKPYFFCNYCDKYYNSAIRRKNHILKHHPDQPLPPTRSNDTSSSLSANIVYFGKNSVNVYKCRLCEREYTHKHKILDHIRRSHGSHLENNLPESAYEVIQPSTSSEDHSSVSNNITQPNVIQRIELPPSNNMMLAPNSFNQSDANKFIGLNVSLQIVDNTTTSTVNEAESRPDSHLPQILPRPEPLPQPVILKQYSDGIVDTPPQQTTALPHINVVINEGNWNK